MLNDSSNIPAVAVPAKRANAFGNWPWGPGAAILVSVLAFFGAQLVLGAVIGIGLFLAGWSGERIENLFNSIVGQSVIGVVGDVVGLGALWWFIQKHRKANWRLVGFTRRPGWKDLGLMVLGYVIYFTLFLVVSGIASAAFGLDLNEDQDVGFNDVAGALEMAFTFFSLVIMPPLVEEILFRGFLFTGLRKKLRFVWAAIITSLVFAALHLPEGASGLFWVGALDTFLLSLVLCYLREKTGALWAGIGIHMLKNGVAFLFLYVFVGN